MQLAVSRGNYAVVKRLLDAGASPNVVARQGQLSPLLRAVHDDNAELVDLLLAAGADANATTDYGATPLYACRSPVVVARLVAAGADPRRPGAEPCLIGAAVKHNAAVAEALITAGADPSAQSPRSGKTPLHHAAQNRSLEVVEVLLAAGANVLARNLEGRTPLHSIHSGTPRQRAAFITAFVAADNHSWAGVPIPCPGLQHALFSVWQKAPGELSELFKRLEPEVQARARAVLAVLHPHALPDEFRMRLLSDALEDPV